ncbi:alpha/beta hydrolase [Streptomyces sp. ISL-11]|uniref:alpha/beta hydrolase n=1 Tax=Streptomyces sp. ISL-11 TaxID=2819174 RepID=UPI001BE86C25|nr:alpha/beta hydrolase [Streptomyces sp. ISL-11]MBT2386239.1 alpha/beta fold hydrolase [Streptomyces sp. ISL-11]
MFEFTTSRWIRSALTGAVTTAIAAAAVPATAAVARIPAPTPVPERYAAQSLAWKPCEAGSSLECAEMTVPRDWHHPGVGEDLTVAVSRQRAGDPARRRGVLMMAAGGPGGMGLLRPATLAENAPKVSAVYDIVGFDQRGVGRSTRVRCETDAEFQDYFSGDSRDRSPAAVRRTLDNAEKFVDSCRDRSGDLMNYITTDQTVRDMDLYRSLLGERKVSYYGPSYATMIGAYYATEFPQRVERVVLDSNIGFDGTWEKFMLGQPLSFQRRFEQDFLPWLATKDDVYHFGRTAAEAGAKWEKLRRSLADHPLPLGGGRTVDPNGLDAATTGAMYGARNFPDLARTLAALDHWDRATPEERKLVEGAFGESPSADFFAQFFSVTCSDTPWNRDTGHWVKRSATDGEKYPLAGARELSYTAVCANWPDSKTPRIKVTGKGLPPVLMINSLRDPATHYEGALGAHRALRGSRLVTAGGGDHVQYLGGNACVDGIVDDYLLKGALPARDTTCEAGSPPVPGER